MRGGRGEGEKEGKKGKSRLNFWEHPKGRERGKGGGGEEGREDREAKDHPIGNQIESE